MHFFALFMYVLVLVMHLNTFGTVMDTLQHKSCRVSPESQRVSPESHLSLNSETRVVRQKPPKNIASQKITFRVMQKHRQMP